MTNFFNKFYFKKGFGTNFLSFPSSSSPSFVKTFSSLSSDLSLFVSSTECPTLSLLSSTIISFTRYLLEINNFF